MTALFKIVTIPGAHKSKRGDGSSMADGEPSVLEDKSQVRPSIRFPIHKEKEGAERKKKTGPWREKPFEEMLSACPEVTGEGGATKFKQRGKSQNNEKEQDEAQKVMGVRGEASKNQDA